MLKQGLYQKQQQLLSPQQILLMKLLEVPITDLEQRIKEELEQNPALEEESTTPSDDTFEENIEQEDYNENDTDTVDELFEPPIAPSQENTYDDDPESYHNENELPDYKTQQATSTTNEKTRDYAYTNFSLQDHLEEQLALSVYQLNSYQKQIVDYIIGSIDDDGYLRRDIESITDDLAFRYNLSVTDEEVLKCLKIVQTLEPYGIGARDLRECLLLQVQHQASSNLKKFAFAILLNSFDDLAKRHFEVLKRRYQLSDDHLKQVLQYISRLDPKPGAGLQGAVASAQPIMPDFIIYQSDDDAVMVLNDKSFYSLNVSQEYGQMLVQYAKAKQKQTEAYEFISKKINDAELFIETIKVRNAMLTIVGDALFRAQYDYLVTGDKTTLKPLTLKDLSEQVPYDISTLSRAFNGKYIQAPFGVISAKDLFTDYIVNKKGEEIASKHIHQLLQDLIDDENKKSPYTDEELQDELNKKGIEVSRRTVSKYRDVLNIPPARLRKLV